MKVWHFMALIGLIYWKLDTRTKRLLAWVVLSVIWSFSPSD